MSRHSRPPTSSPKSSSKANPIALAKEELVHPVKLLKADPKVLAEVVHHASRGKLGAPRAEALLRSAQQTFYMPYAPEAQSFNLKLMAQAHESIIQHLLPPLQTRIQECLVHRFH